MYKLQINSILMYILCSKGNLLPETPPKPATKQTYVSIRNYLYFTSFKPPFHLLITRGSPTLHVTKYTLFSPIFMQKLVSCFMHIKGSYPFNLPSSYMVILSTLHKTVLNLNTLLCS